MWHCRSGLQSSTLGHDFIQVFEFCSATGLMRWYGRGWHYTEGEQINGPVATGPADCNDPMSVAQPNLLTPATPSKRCGRRRCFDPESGFNQSLDNVSLPGSLQQCRCVCFGFVSRSRLDLGGFAVELSMVSWLRAEMLRPLARSTWWF